ncbi:hypothetical protein N7540_007096 [Penicillium herquei]|nr:hypothetical protein N7540_007096 [Penicillium herquei]
MGAIAPPRSTTGSRAASVKPESKSLTNGVPKSQNDKKKSKHKSKSKSKSKSKEKSDDEDGDDDEDKSKSESKQKKKDKKKDKKKHKHKHKSKSKDADKAEDNERSKEKTEIENPEADYEGDDNNENNNSDDEMSDNQDKPAVIILPFRPKSPFEKRERSPIIQVTEITDDMSDVPMPDMSSSESSSDEEHQGQPKDVQEIDAIQKVKTDQAYSDFEARIARCEEALEDSNEQIASVIQDRLNLLEAQRDERDESMDKWPNLTYSAVRRLDFFERLKAFLIKDGDPNQVISCINAIVKAYKSKKLQWVPGYVTYWTYGKQLTQLRAFDWEEFLKWNFKYKGVKGFWVEGLRDAPVRQFLQQRVCWPARYDTFQELSVKVPVGLKFILPPLDSGIPDANSNIMPGRYTRGETERWTATVPRGTPGEPLIPANPPYGGERKPLYTVIPANLKDQQTYGPPDTDDIKANTSVLFWMTDDTGADVCSIQERDLDQLYHVKNTHEDPVVAQSQPPLLGYYEMRSADRSAPHRFEPCRAMRIHCYSSNDYRGRLFSMLKGAEIIEVLITKNSTNPFDAPVRILGPWLRHRFYTATAPDCSGRLWIFKRHSQLSNVHKADPPYSGAFPVVNNLRIGRDHPAAEVDLLVPA